MQRDKGAAQILEQYHYAADKQATPGVFTVSIHQQLKPPH